MIGCVSEERALEIAKFAFFINPSSHMDRVKYVTTITACNIREAISLLNLADQVDHPVEDAFDPAPKQELTQKTFLIRYGASVIEAQNTQEVELLRKWTKKIAPDVNKTFEVFTSISGI